MISPTTYYGRGGKFILSGDLQLYSNSPRVVVVDGVATPRNVFLTDATKCRVGGPRYFITNAGTVKITIKNIAGTTLATLNGGQSAVVNLLNNAINTGTWMIKVVTFGFAIQPVVVKFHYMFGGDTSAGNGSSQTIEYNQQLDVMTTKSNISTACRLGASFEYGATLHRVGGETGGAGSLAATQKNQEYDPDTWSTLTDIPDANGMYRNTGASIAGSAGYTIGGDVHGGLGTGPQRRRNYEWTGAWATKTSRPLDRRTWNVSGATIGAALYIFGGSYDGAGANIVDSYVSDTYTVRTSRPIPLGERAGSAGIGTFGYIFGAGNGVSEPATNVNATNVAWKYDSTLDSYAAITNFVDGPSYYLPCSAIDGIIQIMGGQIATSITTFKTANNRNYNPTLDSYTAKTALPLTTSFAMNQQQPVTV